MSIVLSKKAWGDLVNNLAHPKHGCEFETDISVERTDDGKIIIASEHIDENAIIEALKKKES